MCGIIWHKEVVMMIISGILKKVTEQDLKLLHDNPSEFWEYISEIGDFAFTGLSIESIVIPSQIVHIGRAAFQYCRNLKKVTFNTGLQTIEEQAFDYCVSLSEIFLPQGLVSLNEGCFGHCHNLKFVGLPDSLNKISAFTFCDCRKLRELVLPDSVFVFDRNACSNCLKLKKVVLSKNLVSINDKTFKNCSSLKTLELNSKITKITCNSVVGCKNLKNIYWLDEDGKRCGNLSEKYLKPLIEGTQSKDLEKDGNDFVESKITLYRRDTFIR